MGMSRSGAKEGRGVGGLSSGKERKQASDTCKEPLQGIYEFLRTCGSVSACAIVCLIGCALASACVCQCASVCVLA